MAESEGHKKGNPLAPKRDVFVTAIGVLTATLGSAVGLGNIWKFPYLTGVNGGAAFLFIYIVCTLAVGLPVMISELVVGRRARADAITSFQKLAPKQPWWLIGAAGMLSAVLIMAFYTEISGWVFAYIFKAASGSLSGVSPEAMPDAFTSLVTNPWQSLIWQWVVLAWVSAIIIAGVSKGIERMTKRLLPLLLGLLLIVVVRSLTLPGAGEGLKFLFRPDFSKVTGATILTALGLAAFKLSVGMGAMVTYGSYWRDDQNIPATATKVALADLGISILAGIAIFPAVFAFGFEPNSGPNLLFITIPAVFNSMPLGRVLMPLFFVLTAIAATGAMVSLLEVPTAWLIGRFKWSRVKATLVTAGVFAALGSLAALSSSSLADVKVLGKTFFDLFDYASSNVLLPLGGLFVCLYVGWRWSGTELREALSNGGTLGNEGIVKVIRPVMKLVAPALVAVALLSGLGIIG